ncbi:hypothetical protein Fmac_015324 [Flemingia macrophylla]|uniref:Uncharacterized protein n=1 Tax=Flemingia macrophylla TaxID=520843 RepID=A0ABD1MEA9_9FABA
MIPLSLEEFMMWLQIHLLKLEKVHDVATDTSAEARKLEGKLDALLNLVTQLAENQKPASIARVYDIRSSNDHHTSVSPSSQQSGQFRARNDAIVIRGVHDVATDTSVEATKLEGALDALVSLVTQLAGNQKPASVARVCNIRSSNDHHTSVCPSSQQSGVDEHPEFSARNDAIVIRGVYDVATDTSAEARKLDGKFEALVSLVTQLAANQNLPLGVHDMATDTSTEARKMEGKFEALVSLMNQLAANQKPASVARVCGIYSSNDHHTSVCPSLQQSGVDEHPKAYAANTYSETTTGIHLLKLEGWERKLEGVHDVATDTSAEARKLEGNLDALVSLVTQLAANQKPASVARRLMLQTPIADHHSSRDKALDREDSSQLLKAGRQATSSSELGDSSTYLESKPAFVARVRTICSTNDHHTSVCPSSQQSGVDELPEAARNDAIVIRGVHDVATNTSTEARKLEGRPETLVSLVNQLAANQKPAYIARVCDIRSSNNHNTSACPSSQQSGFSARNDAIVIRGVHDVAIDTSAEARKLEGKLDALVNLVTQLAANQKHAFVPRVCDIRFSNDHHTSFSARKDAIVIRGVEDGATDTFAEARKLGGKLDALVTLVTQLAANQKPASVARVCGIRSSNDHHTSVCSYSQQSGFSARNDAIVIRRVDDVATDTSAEARKLEGKLDALVNSVTQLAANQKHASVGRVCDIHSSNDHHTRVHDVAVDTSAEARKLEGKLDALVNLVTQLAANQKPSSIARVCDIRSSNDHHTSVCPSSQQSGFSTRNDAIVIRGVSDVARDTSAEAKKLEGKLDALVNLVTQLAANQKPAAVASQTTTAAETRHLIEKMAPNSYQFNARNDANVIKGVHDVATYTSAKARKLEGKLDALVNLVTQLAANQKPASVARVCDIRSSNDHHTSVCPSSQQSGLSARNDSIVIRGVHDMATDTFAEARKQEGELDALVNLVTHLADNQKPASVARVCGIHSSNDHHTSVCPSSQQSGVDEHPEAYTANTYRVHDVATDTSAEARKQEGKLDAHVNLVTQLAANQKPASVARVNDIHSSDDYHTNTSAEARKLERKLHALVNLVTQLAANQKPASVARVNDIHSSDDYHTNTSAEARKLERKLHALVNLVTQLAANQKPASVARVCGIRSSQDHHNSVCPSSQQSGVDEHPVAYALQTPIADHHNKQRQDTSAEARKLEGKLDALVNLVTQLDANRSLSLVARVCGIHTSAVARKMEGKLDALVHLVTQLATNQKPASVAKFCDIRSSNDHHTSVCPSSQQSGVDEHPFNARNDTIVIRVVHDVATDTSAQARKLEGKLDALVNMVTQLAANRSLPLLQGSATSVLPMTTTLVSVLLRSNLDTRNDVILIRGVHDVATDTSVEARKLEGKLDALVNLVTQLAANKKPASVARVCGIRSSNDHHKSFSARNDAIVIRGVHDVATDTSAEIRKLEGKLDALVHLVAQLATNQKLASVARVCGIRSSNDHHTNVCPSLQQSGFSARNDTIVIRVVHDVATDTSAQARNLEGKLDALVNLVTQLAANQKPASVARVYGIRFSNDYHTSVCRSSQQFRVDEHPEAYAANTYSIPPQQQRQGVHDVATDTSVEARKLEGKLDALVNLVTRLAANRSLASLARVCGIRSSNDYHTRFSARNDAIVISGVHDVATDTSVQARKLEGKLDALVNSVTQLPANHKPTSVARVCGIHSSNDHHTSVCFSSQQSGVDEHPEAYAANTYSRPPQQGVHDVATDTSAEARKLEGKLDALVNSVTQLAAN